MIFNLLFKKLGNNWYIDIPHNDPTDIAIDAKLGEWLNKLDVYSARELTISLYRQDSFINPEGLIQFADEDILRYFTTEDDFDITFYINDSKFKMSSRLYSLLELEFNFEFHVNVYRIELSDYGT